MPTARCLTVWIPRYIDSDAKPAGQSTGRLRCALLPYQRWSVAIRVHRLLAGSLHSSK